MKNFRISLKQWRMLHAVVDCGGFAGAAQFLNISQSAISYTIAKLQEQLGVQLLRVEGRKARITEQGLLLLERSRHLIREALELEEFAEQIGRGNDMNMRIVADHHFPDDLLMSAMREFLLQGCMVNMSLSEVNADLAGQALLNKTADLVICDQVPSGFLGDPLLDVEYVAVAHRDHALFKMDRPVCADDLERTVQVSISSAFEHNKTRDTKRSAKRALHWQVSSVDSAIAALQEGIGYAWLAKHQVEKLLEQGSLKELPLSQGRICRTTFYLVRNHLQLMHRSHIDKLAETLHSLALMHSTGVKAVITSG
ncbi:LysR family transcriptional regulator [Oxalobacteraceae bacterium R-40]|uniref:LysR family transcriptional regulator n=1 Tax=Keguizhuia sedimenti TaxID=3064264 RepID=A0ABU1BJT6_9BURK|nr:LysR family transcriptional regulator [Oxalobacteraceae bacterium R-40]